MVTHVLVAEDHPAVRDALRMILEAEGYHVTLAADGQAALDQLASSLPDLVLTDLHMPAMPGWELPSRILALQRRVPVIFMSAAIDLPALAAAYGADAYLAKPFGIDDLLALVSRFTLHAAA